MLKFSKATKQAKLGRIVDWMTPILNVLKVGVAINFKKIEIWSFSLPSGAACPAATECKSTAERVTGKITDGIDTIYRCFSASQEAVFKPVRQQRWHNFDILRKLDTAGMVAALCEAIPDSGPATLDVIRIHVGGDFFNQKYFDAWLEVAKRYPNKIFYAYTKSLNYWVERIDEIPSNLRLNASRGGRHDHLITEHNLKCAEVVFSVEEAESRGLEIDHDESHAILGEDSFALLLHGTQPKGSEAAEAIKKMNTNKVEYAYSTGKGN